MSHLFLYHVIFSFHNSWNCFQIKLNFVEMNLNRRRCYFFSIYMEKKLILCKFSNRVSCTWNRIMRNPKIYNLRQIPFCNVVNKWGTCPNVLSTCYVFPQHPSILLYFRLVMMIYCCLSRTNSIQEYCHGNPSNGWECTNIDFLWIIGFQ